MTAFFDQGNPTKEEFEELWRTAQIVPDTNVLLNAFRYPRRVADQLLMALRAADDRLWVPHQVGLEFGEHPPEDVLSAPFKRIRTEIEKALSSVKRVLGELSTLDHRTLNVDSIELELDRATQKILDVISQQRYEAIDESYLDSLRDQLLDLLDGRVGSALATDRIIEICREGRERYELMIPPGYSDGRNKSGVARFGDLILWYETLEHATQMDSPTILITDDRKEDWYVKVSGQVKGPRPELIDEHYRITGHPIWVYTTPAFMEHASRHFEVALDRDSLAEIERALDDFDLEAFLLERTRERIMAEIEEGIVAEEEERRRYLEFAGGETDRSDELEPIDSDRDDGEPIGVDASLEAILRELKARGIGRH